ncbi:Holliday junction branch migration DNA helicase RuvB [Kiritimatiellota bacterium B12222]|nr:Holliday junction branch migration DNA helicase RuvB [Kiritimatiellota bacterium B12222]
MNETNHRPASFAEYVGQTQAKTVLQILCKSAKKKGTSICHTMLSGRPGLGKTTLCRILANEMGSNLIELIASNLQDPQQLTAQLAGLQENDILFIDEIHSLPRAVEEILYSAMEDGRITMVVESEYGDLMKNLGMSSKQTRTVTLDLPPFTFIGATTLAGMVSAPLRSRFIQTLDLEPYAIDELKQIVQNASSKMNFDISPTLAIEVAKRARNTARIALGHLKWIIEYCIATDSSASTQTVTEAFILKGIDDNGLTKIDRSYLQLLVNAKSPVGLNSIAASLGESSQTLSESVEPYLMQEGYIRRANRGRVAEQKAFNLILKMEVCT